MFNIGFPCIVYGFILFLFLPESLHFLVTQNRQKAFLKWVYHASDEKFISKIDSNNLFNIKKNTKKENNFLEKFLNLFFERKLFFRILIFSFIWTTDVLVYFGTSLFSVKLIGNQYFNYIAIGLIEIPAVAAGPFLLEKIGRKLTIVATHLTTSLAFTVAAFFFKDSPEVQLCLWLLAKFAIAAAFMCIFAYASESFPTQERNFSIGICSVVGKLFGSSAPFIQTTAQLWEPLPLVIFGTFSAIAGLITFLLPETNHKQLPDTVDNMS